jgi:hypothetical protein
LAAKTLVNGINGSEHEPSLPAHSITENDAGHSTPPRGNTKEVEELQVKVENME